MKKPVQGAFLTPGEEICVIEEYIPGPGSYADDKGFVRSSVVGKLVIDLNQRIISVYNPLGKPAVPRPGEIVRGVVESITDDLAFIDIFSLENKPSANIDYSGIIHVSQVSEKFIEKMGDVLKPGDIVRARILNAKPPYQLTLRGPGLGVILGFCGRCGAPLIARSDEELVCSKCRRLEKRKVALRYYAYRGVPGR